jgi:isocitrate dehydrogenase kinase/phosphatase
MNRNTSMAELARQCAQTVVEAFLDYNERFAEITLRARARFEQRDPVGQQNDNAERIDLYEASVQRVLHALTGLLGEQARDKTLWAQIRECYGAAVEVHADSEFFKTFFSSITRRVFATVGVDRQVEFSALEVEPARISRTPVAKNVYLHRGSLQFLFDEVLADFSFSVPWRNTERSIRYLSAEVEAFLETTGERRPLQSVELLKPIFYQPTRAYLVGCMVGRGYLYPLVIALKNGDDGILVDAVIMSENDVSMLFSFTRSYFHADLKTVGAAVVFLKRLMPRKPVDEIYTVLGRAKQGKTERYRALVQHIELSTDLYVHAAGDVGMVMIVFTLPSYDVVFKVIRDKFAYPKSMTRQEVKGKYQLVFKHDRAGRLVDAQEFRSLEFPRDRFEPELLVDLLQNAAETCRIESDQLIIEHLYIERQLRPLNLYLQEVDEARGRLAAIDYGQAIRDLSRTNIFAGDLLLKNFGVTRHGRVIFYDYDELCLVTECNFRDLPAADTLEDEMRAEAWFYVGPEDVFPEQFVNFLGFQHGHREAFMDHHADLLTANYWRQLKQQLLAGDLPEVLPYQPRSWVEHRGPDLYATRPQPHEERAAPPPRSR